MEGLTLEEGWDRGGELEGGSGERGLDLRRVVEGGRKTGADAGVGEAEGGQVGGRMLVCWGRMVAVSIRRGKTADRCEWGSTGGMRNTMVQFGWQRSLKVG